MPVLARLLVPLALALVPTALPCQVAPPKPLIRTPSGFGVPRAQLKRTESSLYDWNGHLFGVAMPDVGNFPMLAGGPRVTCPMPVAVPDSLAARAMPTARSDATTTERMPVATGWCVNPLGPRTAPKRP